MLYAILTLIIAYLLLDRYTCVIDTALILLWVIPIRLGRATIKPVGITIGGKHRVYRITCSRIGFEREWVSML